MRDYEALWRPRVNWNLSMALKQDAISRVSVDVHSRYIEKPTIPAHGVGIINTGTREICV